MLGIILTRILAFVFLFQYFDNDRAEICTIQLTLTAVMKFEVSATSGNPGECHLATLQSTTQNIICIQTKRVKTHFKY